MNRVYLGLGSNKGDRLALLNSALQQIALLPGTTVTRVSSVYETEPFGEKEQEDFLNAALELHTDFTPEELHSSLKEIELNLGRSTTKRWGPREIDIDLLFYGSLIASRPGLTVPHPGVAQRRFVLEPLAEIAASFHDPRSGLVISELLAQCPDSGSVRRTTSQMNLPVEER